eukprot:TRINITY_DN110549_c0_g1_i1.p1 TRINITY_DN110549_c0_g1~~TRINITY_DN110549_c0_g1_i1.p1  ORF type:complete len:191 (-),score=34.19 TRINITY_DN110549_c0_g1_i1:308-880(-)
MFPAKTMITLACAVLAMGAHQVDAMRTASNDSLQAQTDSLEVGTGAHSSCPWKNALLKGVANLSTIPVMAAVEAGRQSIVLADSNPQMASQLGAACDSFVRFDQQTFRPFVSKNVTELFQAMRAKTDAQAHNEPALMDQLIMVFKARMDAAAKREDDEMVKIYRSLVAIHIQAQKTIADGGELHAGMKDD